MIYKFQGFRPAPCADFWHIEQDCHRSARSDPGQTVEERHKHGTHCQHWSCVCETLAGYEDKVEIDVSTTPLSDNMS